MGTHPWLILVDGQEIFLAPPPVGSNPEVWLVLNSSLQAGYANSHVGYPVSIGGGAEVKLSIRNLSDVNLEVYWIQYRGIPQIYDNSTIANGQTFNSNSFANHMWAVKQIGG